MVVLTRIHAIANDGADVDEVTDTDLAEVLQLAEELTPQRERASPHPQQWPPPRERARRDYDAQLARSQQTTRAKIRRARYLTGAGRVDQLNLEGLASLTTVAAR